MNRERGCDAHEATQNSRRRTTPHATLAVDAPERRFTPRCRRDRTAPLRVWAALDGVYSSLAYHVESGCHVPSSPVAGGISSRSTGEGERGLVEVLDTG
jgi:hypothetical protein